MLDSFWEGKYGFSGEKLAFLASLGGKLSIKHGLGGQFRAWRYLQIM